MGNRFFSELISGSDPAQMIKPSKAFIQVWVRDMDSRRYKEAVDICGAVLGGGGSRRNLESIDGSAPMAGYFSSLFLV